MDTHVVHTSFVGGMAFDAEITDHHLVMDTTPEGGGNNTGPSPKRLMLAALAGCTGIDVVSILNKMKVEFSQLSIDVSATLTETHPRTYDHVTITYKVKLEEKDRSKMEKAIALSRDKYCGVSAMFSKFATINTQLEFI